MRRRVLRYSMLGLLMGIRFVLGKSFIKMNFQILSQLASAAAVLRALGASVGTRTHIHSDICVYNLNQWSCRNLKIGSNVYIGPRCLFDLTSPITIEDDVSVSAQVSFITHLDVGNQPLKARVPRREGPILLKSGAWVGVNTTILQDVTIGEYAMVGALSLVNRDVPADSVVVGIPGKVIHGPATEK
jgi:acetyltransferase-like isoleucine patch superfamily enzyme